MKKISFNLLVLFLLCTSLLSCGKNKQNAITLVTPANKEIVKLVADPVKEYLANGNIKSYETVKADYQEKVKLSWTDNLPVDTEYTVQISLHSDFSDEFTYITKSKEVLITNLYANTEYFWKVYVENTTNDSATGVFTTENMPRYLNVDGLINVRDIGGWTGIAQGLIYRGSEMNNIYNITENGINTMKNSLGIKSDIDLRTTKESLNITESPLGKEIGYYAYPSFEGYIRVIDEDQIDNYQAIFKLLAKKESYPLYLHCYLGADRTGTLACILESLMGGTMESTVKDYELTTFSGIFRESKGKYQFIQSNITAKCKADTLSASVELYLETWLGLSKQEITALKDILSGKVAINKGSIAEFRQNLE